MEKQRLAVALLLDNAFSLIFMLVFKGFWKSHLSDREIPLKKSFSNWINSEKEEKKKRSVVAKKEANAETAMDAVQLVVPLSCFADLPHNTNTVIERKRQRMVVIRVGYVS